MRGHPEYERLGNVFVGPFPTGFFNAQVRPVVNGHLILVHNGAPLLIYQLLKIMMQSLTVKMNSSFVRKTGEEFLFPPPELTGEEAMFALANVLIAHLYVRDPAAAPPLPTSDSTRMRISVRLTRECELFMLAHEFAHVIECHDMAQESSLTPDEIHSQELYADSLASIYLLRRGNESDPSLRICGALITFKLDEFVTDVARGVGWIDQVQSAPGHPTPDMRSDVYHEFYRKILGPRFYRRAFLFSRHFIGWLDRVKAPLISLLLENAEAIRPPSKDLTNLIQWEIPPYKGVRFDWNEWIDYRNARREGRRSPRNKWVDVFARNG